MRNERLYETSCEAEPINLFFETTFHVATGLVYPEYCAYMLPTEEVHQTVCGRGCPWHGRGVCMCEWVCACRVVEDGKN